MPAFVGQGEDHVELRGYVGGVLPQLDLQTGKFEFPPHGGNPGEHGLEQGRAGGTPGRVDQLDDSLEGEVDVLESLTDALVHALQGVLDPKRAGEVGPQGEGVDEEADETLDVPASAVRGGRADHDVVLPGEQGQQHGPAGEDGCVEGDIVVRGQRAQGPRQVLVDVQGHPGAAEVLLGRAGPIGGEGEHGRGAPQCGGPVVAVRYGLVSRHPLPLPARVVAVLPGQFGQ